MDERLSHRATGSAARGRAHGRSLTGAGMKTVGTTKMSHREYTLEGATRRCRFTPRAPGPGRGGGG